MKAQSIINLIIPVSICLGLSIVWTIEQWKTPPYANIIGFIGAGIISLIFFVGYIHTIKQPNRREVE